MIAFFGTYRQLTEYARENEIPMKEMVLANLYPEKMQGSVERIEIVMAGDFNPTKLDDYTMGLINAHNRFRIPQEEK